MGVLILLTNVAVTLLMDFVARAGTEAYPQKLMRSIAVTDALVFAIKTDRRAGSENECSRTNRPLDPACRC
jgi:hypothetical protein